MKTFVILFAIAVSLPSEAQRVRENIRQKVAVAEQESAPVKINRGQVKQVDIQPSVQAKSTSAARKR